jgi:hypothetical protein
MKKNIALQYSLTLEVAFEQIARCRSCTSISDHSSRTPVQCIKFAGSHIPISVNLAACHTCGDYKLN